MRLSIFTLCDYAQGALGKLTIIGAFNRIFSDSFPFAYKQGFNIVARVVYHEYYSGNLLITFKDPDGKDVLPNISSDVVLKVQEDGRECCFDLNLGLNPIIFPKSGVYKISIKLGDIEETLNLYVDQIKK